MNNSRSLAILAALVLLGTGRVSADEWRGDFSSDWFSPGAWRNFEGPPAATEDAVFPAAANLFGEPIPLGRTEVELSASTTVRLLEIESPHFAQFSFIGSGGAVLTATQKTQFRNSDLQSLNVHTVSSLGLNTPRVDIFNNAILLLNSSTVTTDLTVFANNGRIDVNDGSSLQTLGYAFNNAAGELRVNSGGELRVAGDATLLRGTTTINSGGELNAASGVDLEYNGSALLQFSSDHAVDAGVHLKATGGGDVTGSSFIDVGNGNASSLTVTGSGSTFTSGGSTSDWGLGASGNATVTISSSAVATVHDLQAGTGNARFVGTVSGGATLRTATLFTMGGGSTVRQVSLDVNGGTFEADGLATFNNLADLNLVSGTVNFDGGATFNAGSRMDWSGGSVNLGANKTLRINGGAVIKTNTTGFIFSGNSATQILGGGGFSTPSYFDLGNATLDMNNGTLTVGTAGGTVSDWGAGTSTTATLSNNAVATYNSGLQMSFSSAGTTNATISGGARLVANFLSAGGGSATNVMLNVTGGRVESSGDISLFRGTTANVTASGRVEGRDIVLSSPGGGTASLTVTGDGAVLDANDELFAGQAGTTTLTISGGADGDVSTRTVLGELAGANSTVTVTGSGSTLLAGNSLKVGDGGAAQLNIFQAASVSVFGGVTVNAASEIDLVNGSLEIAAGSSIANAGEILLTGGSQIRGDISNAGELLVFDSSITRGVTLLANSQMLTDNSSVGSLVQEADADLLFQLRSVSDFDNLSVTGSATLGGDLLVSLAGGFSPTLGAEFPILSAASVIGPFATDFSAAPLGSGLAWNVLRTLTGVTLKVVAGTSGDYNNDGTVNAADYVAWRKTPNNFGGNPLGYTTWRSNFGETPGSGATQGTSSNATVPEPSAGVMLAIAVMSLRRRNYRKSS